MRLGLVGAKETLRLGGVECDGFERRRADGAWLWERAEGGRGGISAGFGGCGLTLGVVFHTSDSDDCEHSEEDLDADAEVRRASEKKRLKTLFDSSDGLYSSPFGIVGVTEAVACAVGEVNVSVAILGLGKDFLRRQGRARSIANGGFSDMSERLRESGRGIAQRSGEKRSRTPSRRMGLVWPGCLAISVRLTVPLSSPDASDNLSYSPRRALRVDWSWSCGSGASVLLRLGRTLGSDMSPVHSSATMGASMDIPCTNSPSIL